MLTARVDDDQASFLTVAKVDCILLYIFELIVILSLITKDADLNMTWNCL